MNLNHMLVFAEVVDCGGFTAAGNKLAIPKSNISRTITNLESDLGIKLLERTTRKLKLTEVGKAYYQRCLRIREESQAAQRLINTLADEPSGELAVCATVEAGQHLIAPLLASFHQRYPKIRINLQLTNRKVDMTAEYYDLAIQHQVLSPLETNHCQLSSQSLRLYVSPDYLANSQLPLTQLSDLQQHPTLVMGNSQLNTKWSIRRQQEHHELALQPVFVGNDYAVIRQLTEDGLGVALLPRYICQQKVVQGSLLPLFPEWHGEQIDFQIIWPKNRAMAPKSKVFIDFLTEMCS